MTRAIVRDPDVRSGKWIIFGTRITVTDVRRWARDLTLDQINDEYHWPWLQLTQEELDACLAWEFPAGEGAELLYGHDINVRCSCGEDMDTGWFEDRDLGTFACEACGRVWRLELTITEEAAS